MWSSLTTIAPMLVGIVLFAVAARLLGPAEFGILALASSIVALSSGLVPMGFGEALVQRHDVADRHLTGAFWLGIGVSLVVWAALSIVGALVGEALGHSLLGPMLGFMGFRIVVDAAAMVPNALLARRMDFRSVALRSSVGAVVSALVGIPMLLAGYGAWAVASAQLVSAAVSMMMAFLAARWLPRGMPTLSAMRELARFGAFASTSRFIGSISVDSLTIGFLLGPTALGLYDFARKLAGVVSEFASGVIGGVSFSLYSSLQTEQDKLRHAHSRAIFVSSAVCFPAFVGLAMTGERLVPMLLGVQWLDAVPALQAFCAIGLATSVNAIQSSLIRSQGRMGWWLRYQIQQQALSLLAILVSFPFGLQWVAIAMAVKVWIGIPRSVEMSARMVGTGVSSYLRVLATPAAATMGMAATIACVDWAFDLGAGSASALRDVAVGIAAYGVFMVSMNMGRTKAWLGVGARLLRCGSNSNVNPDETASQGRKF